MLSRIFQSAARYLPGYGHVKSSERSLLLADVHALAKAFRQDLLWSWVVYWVIFGVIQTFRYYEHHRASELRLEKMERSFSQACPSSAKSEAC
jgi:hypothetical protein